MKSLSKIANLALGKITKGRFTNLPKLAIIGLLNDFQITWLRRLNISCDFEMLDRARSLCNGENKAVFEATQCKSIEDIRKIFDEYIKEKYKNDHRVILSLTYDGKQIDAEWIGMNEYI